MVYDKSHWVRVTLDYGHPAAPHEGAVHVRIFKSQVDDWSGWADNEEAAFKMAAERRELLK